MILLTSAEETGSRPCRDTESEIKSGNSDGKLDENELTKDLRAQILSEKYAAKSLHVMLLGTSLSVFVCSMFAIVCRFVANFQICFEKEF